MKEQNHIEIITQLCISVGELRGKVDIGFSGINSRLDKQNGIVKGHDERIDSHDRDITNLKTKMAFYGGLGGAIVSLFVVIVAHYLEKFI